MRVLHILNTSVPYRHSGYAVRSKYIVDTQQALGIEPIVLTPPGFPGGGRPPGRVERVDGITYLRQPDARRDGAAFLRRGGRVIEHGSRIVLGGSRAAIDWELAFRDHIERAIETHAPDVLHVASPALNVLIASAVARTYALPVLYEVRGFWHDTETTQGLARDSVRYRRLRWLFRRALKQADHVVTLAETMKRELVREGAEPGRVSIVPNAVDPGAFRPRPLPDRVRGETGLDPGDFVIGYIGSIRRLEGLDGLLVAARELVRSGLPVKVLLVGDGSALPHLVRRAVALGIGDRVLVPGRVAHQNVASYYAMLDVFVLPRIDARVTQLVTPLKPFEVLAMGKSLLVSGVDALREIVEDGVTGLVCAVDDPADLARKCERLIRDPRLRERLGRAGRRWVLAHRTWPDVVSRYEPIYAQLVGRRAGGRPAFTR